MDAIQKMKEEGIYTETVWGDHEEAVLHFQLDGLLMKNIRYGNGHINDTFLVTLKKKMEQ